MTNILGFVACDSAGVGVLNAARKTMARMLGNTESAFESASRQFWVVDAKVRPNVFCQSVMWPSVGSLIY